MSRRSGGPYPARSGPGELDVQLAGVLLDRPGGERVAEAMSVDLGEAGLTAPTPQHLLEAVVAQAHAGEEPTVASGGEEQRT